MIDGLDNQGVFFRLNGVQGRATRLQISDLTIRRYRTAIILYGSREHPPSWNGFNTVERVAFEDIGARGATTGSTGALILINSRSNRIRENRFSNVYNVSGCGAFHAIYMAHFSSANEVGANHFDQRCGDPIRIRDASNDNVFRDNTFAQPAPAALYTEWFCDKAFQPRCTKRTPECPPAGNAFEHAGQSFRSTVAASPVYADLGQKYFPRSCRCQPGCRSEP